MKVLLVNSVCGSGSTGKICVDLYDELKKREHECVIAYGRGDANSNYNTYRIGSKLNNYIDGVKSRVFDNQGFNSKNPTRKFIRYIKEYKPDVIHLHNLHGYYLNIEVLFNFLKNEFKGKVIWTFHDCWPFSPHSAYIDYENGILPTREDRRNLKRYPKSILKNNSIRNYKKKKELLSNYNELIIITPSEWLNRMVKKSFFTNSIVMTINNGINTDIFYPKINDLDQKKLEKLAILGVANIWDERKGLVYFNELCNRLDDSYNIHIIGKLGKNQILHKRIIHEERTVNQESLADLYRKVDVFLNPTLEDNYPTTNLEAIACGTPVILFDTGGNREMIFDSLGETTEKKDTKSIIKSINKLRAKISDKNLEVSNETLAYISKERMVEEYIKVYENKEDM
ncbi:glycosyltransferase [Vagococcus sp. JNUCC 83]